MSKPVPEGRTKQSLLRLMYVCDSLLTRGYYPGVDVSMFRALRELHSVLGQPDGEVFDPNRLVRAMLFHGLREHQSWTEVPAACKGVYDCGSSVECSECGMVVCDHAGCDHD